jgi:homoserine dehydrogenase
VVADLIDVARNEYGPAFAMPVGSLARSAPRRFGQRRTGRSILRLHCHRIKHRRSSPRSLTAMRDAGVSIESMIPARRQRGRRRADRADDRMLARSVA